MLVCLVLVRLARLRCGFYSYTCLPVVGSYGLLRRDKGSVECAYFERVA